MSSAVSRRRLAALIAGAAVCPELLLGPASQAATLRQAQATRLAPTGDQALYVPPIGLKASNDLFSRMAAPVMIDGKGPFPFVVDTGANQSVICAELAEALGLPAGDPAPLHGVAGVEITGTVRVKNFQPGELKPRDSILSVLPRAAIGGDGFLGIDQMHDQRLILDFKHRRIVIEPSQGSRRNPYDYVLPATHRDGQLTLINGEIAGIPITAFMDSGAQTSIGNEVLKAQASSRNPDLQWSNVQILSATGQTIGGDWAQLHAFHLGGMKLNFLPVVFADLHTFQIWNMTTAPAILIGVDIMSQFEYVCLDFGRGEVRFRVPRDA